MPEKSTKTITVDGKEYSDWCEVALAAAKKLGITPEELKKRFSELDQCDAANK